MFHFPGLLDSVLGLVTTLLLGVIAHAVKTPKDHERAIMVSQLAEGLAGALVAANPKAEWATLIRDLIARLALDGPTQNAAVIERAAAAALLKLGKTPAP